MLDWLQRFDEGATLWINQWHVSFSDRLMEFMSNIQIWIPFYVLVAFFLFKELGWRRALVVVLATAITFLACDRISTLVKDAVGRLRPCYNERMVGGGLHMLEKRGDLFGFFSAHAANAFGFFTCTLVGFRSNPSQKRYKGYLWLGIVWAVLVSLSRIFVGKHFLGDVIVGTIFGLAMGLMLGYLARYVIGKFIDGDAVSS